MRCREMQDVSAVKDNVELQQGGQKKEVRVAGNSQPQNTILADELSLDPEILRKLNLNFRAGSAAGTLLMPRLVISPTREHPRKMNPEIC